MSWTSGSRSITRKRGTCMVVRARSNAAVLDDGRVYGTWDFKWPLSIIGDGKARVRIAFQQLPESFDAELADFQLKDTDFWRKGQEPDGNDVPFIESEPTSKKPRPRFTDKERQDYQLDTTKGFSLIKRMVACIANRWIDASTGIYFDFGATLTTSYAAAAEASPDEDLPAPLPKSRAAGANRSLRRSKSALFGAADREYDVLISLCDLPLITDRERLLADGSTDSDQVEQFLPGSELGRYAQRVDYGVPTTYLGMREHFRIGVDKAKTVDYLRSHEFVHWTLHEFGHVLGFPHEHQNPYMHASIRRNNQSTLAASKPDIARVLSNALGYEPIPEAPTQPPSPITEHEIESEIATPWPVLLDDENTPLYSDFRTYPSGVKFDDTQSVMFHVYWQRILGVAAAPPRFYFKPHARDLQHLKQMYTL